MKSHVTKMWRTLLATMTLLINVYFVQGQSWNLVWADEFNGSIGPDWVFEIGTGSGGWGNNELQYYRQENASVQNGELVITARNESFGGMNYTSARMKTQGRKSWRYGRVEARIAMPSFQGVWPAFWMLGDNISSVGWPACGEIDIMEHVNTEAATHGTMHWQDHNGNYANYGGSTGLNVTQYHVYAIEWDANLIRWFVDGAQYHEASIAGGVNGTSEFHNNFFILLNMAIGGNWPGFTVDNGAMPAQMRVDYVRVYEWGSGPTGITNLSGQYFIQNRKSGLYIDVADWGTQDGANLLQWHYHGGNNQKFEFIHHGGGVYTIRSVHSGKVMDVSGVSQSNGANIHQWSDVGGANQRWLVTDAGGGYVQMTATHSNKVAEIINGSVDPAATVQQYDNNGQITSHWSLSPVAPAWSTQIEAENTATQSGTQTEACSEGGLNVGWIDTDDWMVWDVNIPSSGSYSVEYRVASAGSGGTIQLENAGGSPVYGSIGVPGTGGWQNWTSISHNVNLNAGQQQIAIKALAGGWNLNWIKISSNGGARLADLAATLEEPTLMELKAYPNPATEYVKISGVADNGPFVVYNLSGKAVLHGKFTLDNDHAIIDLANLQTGTYLIVDKMSGQNVRISKQ